MNVGIYVWRETKGKPVFRFQTEDKIVHQYLSKNNDFKLVGQGVNVNFWIYRAEFDSLQTARQALNYAIKKQ